MRNTALAPLFLLFLFSIPSGLATQPAGVFSHENTFASIILGKAWVYSLYAFNQSSPEPFAAELTLGSTVFINETAHREPFMFAMTQLQFFPLNATRGFFQAHFELFNLSNGEKIFESNSTVTGYSLPEAFEFVQQVFNVNRTTLFFDYAVKQLVEPVNESHVIFSATSNLSTSDPASFLLNQTFFAFSGLPGFPSWFSSLNSTLQLEYFHPAWIIVPPNGSFIYFTIFSVSNFSVRGYEDAIGSGVKNVNATKTQDYVVLSVMQQTTQTSGYTTTKTANTTTTTQTSGYTGTPTEYTGTPPPPQRGLPVIKLATAIISVLIIAIGALLLQRKQET